MTIKDKILAFIKEKGLSREDFYRETGLSASNFKGAAMKSELGGDKIVKILTMYKDLSPDWLLLDEGEMIKQEFSRSSSNVPVGLKTDHQNEGIPLIPVDAMAGAFTGEQQVLEYECERYVVPAFKGADFLIPVKGVSMHPRFSSGDIVACKRLSMDNIFFQWNKVYVIDTAQGPLIKRLKPGSDKDHVLVVSDNTAYDPFELAISNIYHLALVIGVIRLE